MEQIPGERVQIRSGRDKTLRGRIQTWTSPNLMRIKTQFQNSWLQAGGEAVKESTLTGSGIRSQYVLDLGSAVHQTHPGWMSPFPVSSWKRTDCSYNSDFGKWKCVCVCECVVWQDLTQVLSQPYSSSTSWSSSSSSFTFTFNSLHY